MAASTNLCSIDDVRSYLGIAGAGHDEAIGMLIAAASEAIENYCRRRFAEQDYVEYHGGGGHQRVVLRHRPVIAVSGVWDDLAREFGEASEIEPDEYVVDAERGIIALKVGVFSDGHLNVKVAYSAGYEVVPGDLAQACTMLVAAWFNLGRTGGDGMVSRSAGGAVFQYPAQPFPEQVIQVLARYRDPVV